MKNLFDNLPENLSSEFVETLSKNRHVRIEKIVSTGQVSDLEFWYDQDEAEWVILLKGEAKLLFESDELPVHLKPGDYVNIPTHQKHRVEWTSLNEPTVWLAVFYQE